MSESSGSVVPWVVGGGLVLTMGLGGGYLYVSSRNAAEEAKRATLEKELERSREEARRAQEAALAARTPAQQQSTSTGGRAPASSTSNNPLGGLGDFVSGLGSTLNQVTNFFSGFKL
ncbi:MAG TPA: hypothetical protein VK399_01020 [Longimicrobiaceae bacterium]|nr:hypothetical protein [Longimicrobiaceae bacterium]